MTRSIQIINKKLNMNMLSFLYGKIFASFKRMPLMIVKQ